MNTEIVFRWVGKNLHFNEIIIQSGITTNKIMLGETLTFFNLSNNNCEFLSEDLFTGFKNKDEIEIYEGDILEFCNTDGKILIGNVKWNQRRGCYEIIARYNGKIYDRVWLDQSKAHFSKVIGNIYKNMELLNK